VLGYTIESFPVRTARDFFYSRREWNLPADIADVAEKRCPNEITVKFYQYKVLLKGNQNSL